MKVFYSCRPCGIVKVEVLVPERIDEQTALEWVRDSVAWCISEDHRERSPNCTATKMTEVLIPYTGGDIGKETRH